MICYYVAFVTLALFLLWRSWRKEADRVGQDTIFAGAVSSRVRLSYSLRHEWVDGTCWLCELKEPESSETLTVSEAYQVKTSECHGSMELRIAAEVLQA